MIKLTSQQKLEIKNYIYSIKLLQFFTEKMTFTINKTIKDKIINKVRIVKNFPKQDVNFIDISPIFEDVNLYTEIINELDKAVSSLNANKIVGIESRGFLLASPLAIKSNTPLVLARKAGKVPFKPVKEEYNTEYSKAALEISEAQIKKDDKIILVDDIIATGGTAEAVIKIVNKLGGKVVALLTLGDLPDLNYTSILEKHNIQIISLAPFKF